MGGGVAADEFEFVDVMDAMDCEVVELDQEMEDVVQAPLAEAEAERTPAAPLRKSSLFNLIGIKSDTQQLSFVEKVLLTRDDIFALFNAIAPGSIKSSSSAASPGGRWVLDLSRLDGCRLATLGFYGSKRMLAHVLLQHGQLPEPAAQALRDDALPPGLYGALLEGKLVLFYWHPEKKYSAARRSDIACNFIRYLLDLCDTVYCCIDVEDGDAKVSSGMRVAEKKNRTQKLQISIVNSSENDFAVSPGFQLSVPLGSGVVSSMWSAGFHRCALLVPEKYTPSSKEVPHEWVVDADDVPSKMKACHWGDASLDFSKLSEAGFLKFASYAKLEAFPELDKKLDELEERRQESLKKLSNVEDYSIGMKVKALRLLADGLAAYLRLHFPWEESVYRQERDQAAEPCQLIGPNIRDFLDYMRSPGTSTLEEDKRSLETLETKLMTALNGDMGGGVILFVGATITIEGSKITIRESGNRPSGPVRYGDRISGLCEGRECEFRLTDGRNDKRPVFSKDCFTMTLLREWWWKTTKKTDVRFDAVESGFQSWLGLHAMNVGLQKEVRLADFAISHKAELGIEAVDDALLNMVVADTKLLFDVAENVSLCEQKWDEILRLEGSAEFVPANAIGSLTASIYEERRLKFLKSVFEDLDGVLLNYLKSRASHRLESERKELTSSVSKEKSGCVEKYIRKLAEAGDSSRPRITLTRCEETATARVRVMFRREVAQAERVTWKAVELLPAKKDLEAQAQNDGCLIVPKCSGEQDVFDMEASQSTLLKVVLLKSGQVIVFIRDNKTTSLAMHHFGSWGARPTGQPKPFSRGVDLVAFDESLGLLALWNAPSSTIRVFRFDESFREATWNGVSITLGSYTGSNQVTWMEFVPGREELLVTDDTLRVRVFEAVHPAMMKPRSIQLPQSFLRHCLTSDGSCLVAVCGSPSEDGVALSAEVYRLDDSFEQMKTVDLGVVVRHKNEFQVAVVNYGTQMHLVIHDGEKTVRSLSLKVTVSSQTCQLVRKSAKVKATANTSTDQASICHELDYLFHVFDKYATSPPLMANSSRSVEFGLLVDVLKGDRVVLKAKLLEHAEHLIRQLEKDKGKDFSNLQLHFGLEFLGEESMQILHDQGRTMSDFLRQLMSLVPVQIARAQNNNLRPLIDGLEMGADVNYGDAIQLAGIIQFSVYDALLESWTGPVKVISSMGKQSSGKSYLLNHLSGSVLDVAGGRCTDGVWMTCRVAGDCLFVILDFEGLGSFERSDQEDMLLSLLNAAVSNITLFNKKDSHFDKETEAVFERFQNGVSLLKDDEKLFRGVFYMAIKDVDNADVDDLCDEFYSKIALICNKSRDNFLTRMYGGRVEITVMPPFNRREFHESISQISGTVEELAAVHQTGKSFLRDLKLVIAQISSKDWSPIDTKRSAFKVSMLRTHLKAAIVFGCLAGEDRKGLLNFDTEEPVEDGPLEFSGQEFDILDTDLQLAAYKDSDITRTFLEKLMFEFQKVVRRGQGADQEWHSALEFFLGALAERRKARLLDWINVNTEGLSSDGDVQNLLLEVTSAVTEAKEKMALCSCKCGHCFLRCVMEKAHSGDHSCRGTHRCKQQCSFCLEENSTVEECTDKAGHEGLHDCQVKTHTCGKPCHLKNKSSNCNEKCSLKTSHQGDHRCNSKQHMCKEVCALRSCRNTCIFPVELLNHTHACHEKMCVSKCCMKGCNRKCAEEDHFHSEQTGVDHICGNEHQCPMLCDFEGNCEVITQVVKKTRTYTGKRSTFEYDHVSEQNGVRKNCCIPVPPFALKHDGPHFHTLDEDADHFCESKCEGCGYFCHLPINHPGLHDTTHGNMTGRTFVAESDEIEISGRKYEWGESGAAEMCMMHCKAQGRGHIHLTVCEMGEVNGVCGKVKFGEGVRHATQKYGPDFSTPKDEFSHAAYWKRMKFKDPCSEDDQKHFALCGHFCQSAEHNAGSSGGKSYCTEKLWHAPVPKLVQNTGTGYVTDDGHHFACNHSRDVSSHVIFVVDKSGSMGSCDVRPTLAKLPANRLGCVYEAMIRFIRTRLAANLQDVMSVVLFDSRGIIGLERAPMSEAQVDMLLRHRADGCTTYSAGIARVEELITRAAVDPAVAGKAPTIIFLSDGGNNGGVDAVYSVNELKRADPSLVLHTIMFGTDPALKILEDMAKAGNGMFQVTIDEIQLSRSFEGLAKSLRSKVASLM